MGLEESLLDGSAGIQLRFPEGMAIMHSAPGYCELVDEDASVLWQCALSPLLLDLQPENESVLHHDFHRSARAAFDGMWAASRQESGPTSTPEQPRTADET